MLTKIAIENYVYGIVKADGIAATITGNVYPDGQRPSSSTKEDIEIICLTATAGQVAEGSLNILCFVQDVTQAGGICKVANRPRLTTISDRLTELCSKMEADKGYFRFKAKEAVYISEYTELGQHAAVLRLSFYHIDEISNNH